MTIDNFRRKYFFLSNFYIAPVTFEGLTYQNNEAAFQAAKCLQKQDRIPFTEMDPSTAKHTGRHVHLRKDWENVKYQIMEDIVRNKFQQNPDLAQKLIATKDAYLEEENTWGDRIWGTINHLGENHLGKILMKIRTELSQKV